MSWYKIAFPEDVFPFANPTNLEKEAKEIYEKAGGPKDFAVFLQSYPIVYYFTPVATSHCSDLFKNYRGSVCPEPVRSEQPIVWVADDPDHQAYFA